MWVKVLDCWSEAPFTITCAVMVDDYSVTVERKADGRFIARVKGAPPNKREVKRAAIRAVEERLRGEAAGSGSS